MIATEKEKTVKDSERSRFSASITRVDSSTTRVRLTMTAQQQSVGGWSSVSVSKKRARQFYIDAFETIGEKLP